MLGAALEQPVGGTDRPLLAGVPAEAAVAG
jgi:hypothetical protein